MRGKSIARSGIILISAFATLSVYAQQQETPQRPQDFSTAFFAHLETGFQAWAGRERTQSYPSMERLHFRMAPSGSRPLS